MRQFHPSVRAGEPLEARRVRVPIAGPQEIFHGVDCRDPGTWERRAAPQVVSYARAVLTQPQPRGRLRSKNKNTRPRSAPVHAGRGHLCFPRHADRRRERQARRPRLQVSAMGSVTAFATQLGDTERDRAARLEPISGRKCRQNRLKWHLLALSKTAAGELQNRCSTAELTRQMSWCRSDGGFATRAPPQASETSWSIIGPEASPWVWLRCRCVCPVRPAGTPALIAAVPHRGGGRAVTSALVYGKDVPESVSQPPIPGVAHGPHCGGRCVRNAARRLLRK